MEQEAILPNGQLAKPTNGNRVSVACIPCRSRHVRCGAEQPVCSRCTKENRTCQYVKSKRGGLDRARLAAFRRNCSAAAAVAGVGESPPETSPESQSPAWSQGSGKPDAVHRPVPSLEKGLWSVESEASDEHNAAFYGTPDPTPDIHFSSVERDPFLKLYYKHFHRCHPAVLPQQHLQHTYEEAPYQQSLILVIAVMRFIGSLYACKDVSSSLREKVAEGLATAQHLPPDPFLAQFHLLYSIALYWLSDREKSREEIDAAIKIVIDLGMNRRNFATNNAQGDNVLRECYRRTWWQVFIIDAYYAAIMRSHTFPLCEVDTDVELPCEEEEYESGSIPHPKSLEEFDLREFAPETQSFSSFAYLIGATRSLALAFSAVPTETSNWSSAKVIAEADAIADGWFLLLPKAKREVLSEGSVVDELMFQAQLAVHANMIALHRPFSKLPFHSLEVISTCLSNPPDRLPAKDSEILHTQRCLRSIEAQIRLLVLPVQPFRRSPFTICMTAAGTLTLLAAIMVLFTGRQLNIARHQLRLVVGFLKAMGRIWPQGCRSLDESGIGGTATSTPDQRVLAADAAVGTGSVETTAPHGDAGLEAWTDPAMMTFETEEFAESYWDLNHEFQADIPIWVSSVLPA
ncbi:hypothetical protein F5Y16DRAFT_403016 [Xylariaceae sp. FL0255]|nr:hypothetical protein F5Y16DRAFT_403016 [Xylariaceae sp. FL0255]